MKKVRAARGQPGLVTAMLVFALLPCLSGCLPGSSWTSFRGKNGAGESMSSIEPPVGLRWKILLQKHVGQDRFFNQPVVSDNTIYFGSSDGNFYSMDISSGFMNWTVRTSGPVNSVPCVDAKKVYFGSSDGKVYAVNRKTGATEWAFATGGAVNSTLVLWQGMIVAASDTDAVYVLSAGGKLKFRISNEYWYHNSFQVYDDKIVFAPGSPDQPLNLAIFDMKTGKYRWSLDPGLQNYPWFSFPAIAGGRRPRLFYSATGLEDDGRLGYKFFCLDFITGEELWTSESISSFSGDIEASSIDLFGEGILLLDYGAPLLWRNRVIYAPGDEILRCFKAGTGAIAWERAYDEPLSSAASLSGDRLYFGLRSRDGKGALVCAAASSGRELWRVPVDGSILNSPVIAGNRIFFGTDAGCFYVLEEVL